MFCSVCFVEYDENEEHLTHCPICETLLVSSAFEEEVFDDDDEIDFDFDDDDFDDDLDVKEM